VLLSYYQDSRNKVGYDSSTEFICVKSCFIVKIRITHLLLRLPSLPRYAQCYVHCKAFEAVWQMNDKHFMPVYFWILMSLSFGSQGQMIIMASAAD